MKNNFLRIIKGSITSIVLSLAILLIFAVILTLTNIPEKIIPITIIIVSAISIIIGSIVSTKKLKKNGLLNGALVGIFYFIVIYLLSSIIITGFQLDVKSIIMLVVSIIFGMLGGIIGVNI